VTLKLRALRQPDSSFVFREQLRSVCILDDGISAVRDILIWEYEVTEGAQALARTVAERSAKPRAAKRKPKVYSVYKRTVQTGGSHVNEMDE
jgi:hypothetical protein